MTLVQYWVGVSFVSVNTFSQTVSALRRLLASISNLAVSSIALSKNAFHTSGSVLCCCRWAMIVVTSLAGVTMFGRCYNVGTWSDEEKFGEHV